MIPSLDGTRIVRKPLVKQALSLTCPAFELLFGGQKGGGKTEFLVICWLEILRLAHQKFVTTGVAQHKCRIPIFRKNLEDLKDWVAKSHEVYRAFDPGAEWNKNEKTWTFSSGATIFVRHLDSPTDHLGFSGQEFVGMGFDEVQFIPFEAYSFLIVQVRSSDPDYRRMLMVRATANPGGPYGDWVKKHFFIDECKDGGKIFKIAVTNRDGREVTTTRCFIRSRLSDNPYLDPDGTYEARLRATMSPDEIRMFLDGDFDVVAGAFFSSLLRPSLHFAKSDDPRYQPQGSWDWRYSIDWGSTAPAATIWAAKDPSRDRIVIVDELHCPGVTGRTYGEALAKKYVPNKWAANFAPKPEDFWGVIDKQAMDGYGAEETAADGIAKWKFRLFPAQKSPGERANGILQIKERLLPDIDGGPKIVIFEDRCPQLVKALKAINSLAPREPDNYDDHSPYSHAIDSLRFLAMEWPVSEGPVDLPERQIQEWMRLHGKRSRSTSESPLIQSGYGD